jgi:hypothetical protein
MSERHRSRDSIRAFELLKAPRGYGWLTNPRRAAYNRVYNRPTVGLGKGCAVALASLAGAAGFLGWCVVFLVRR